MRSSKLIVEHRSNSIALSKDLASHISHRYTKGKVTVVTNRPQALMSSVRKQWLRLIRLTLRERASTLNHQRKDNLSDNIRGMQAVGFTAKDPADEPHAYISLATPSQLLLSPPACSTLYIVEHITKLDQHMLVTWMPPGSLVVIYGE